MRKSTTPIKHRITKRSLLVFGLLIGSLLLVYVLRPPCLFLTVFGVPCPSCGMSRAADSLLHLHFAEAWQYHPMVYAVPLALGLVLCSGNVFRQKRWNTLLIAALVTVYVLCYFVRLLSGQLFAMV